MFYWYNSLKFVYLSIKIVSKKAASKLPPLTNRWRYESRCCKRIARVTNALIHFHNALFCSLNPIPFL